jgi:hypothetical protein
MGENLGSILPLKPRHAAGIVCKQHTHTQRQTCRGGIKPHRRAHRAGGAVLKPSQAGRKKGRQ